MENITLKIQYGNFSVEVSGPSDYAEKKLEELLKKYGNVSKVEMQTPKTASIEVRQSKMRSPAEFIKYLSPKSSTDQALILGYYLEKVQNKENFSTADLAEINKIAKQPSFTNLSDSVGRLIQQGLVMGAGQIEGKRTYTLTTTGEDAVTDLIKSKEKES